MKHRIHYPDAEKDQVPPGARYMARAERERQRARSRMDAVDPSESTRRMNEAAGAGNAEAGAREG